MPITALKWVVVVLLFAGTVILLSGFIIQDAFAFIPINGSQCYGYACHGLNPQSLGCNADAKISRYIDLFAAGGAKIGAVQNRTSAKCSAQWERTVNSSGQWMYGEGSIRWGGTNYTPGIFSVVSPAQFKTGSVYTAMYGIDGMFGASLNCGALFADAPVYPPPQPINLNSTYGIKNCRAR